jgi:prepilin-type N-terminal cleavage/methylation domain-containing protein
MRLPGFTLIELVIYMAILGILGAGVFSAYTFFLRHQITTRQIAELRSASDDLTRHFHEYFGGADRITLVGRGHQICAIATHHEFLERTGLTLTSGEKVTAHSFGGVSGSTSRSLSFWILAPDQASPQTIIDFGTDQPGRRWQVITDADGRVLLNISGISIRGHTSLRDGNWHHVMLVFDAARDAHLTSANLNIYVDGETETLTQAPGHPIIADTDISAPMSLGGSASDSSFIGTLAAVKLWEKALDPAAIWPELLSSTAIDRNGRALELQLTANLDDTSGRNHSMNGPSSLTFAAKHRSYSKKTVFSFSPNPGRAPFYLLWQKRYMSGIREPSSDRCETSDETRGWSLSADHHWHLKQEAPFHLENGILEIRAEIADQVAGRITSVSSDTRIITHSGDSPDILCRISPGITGFDTGDEPMAKAVIRIDPDHFEADEDMLFFAANIS